MYSITEGFDPAFKIRHNFKHLYGERIYIHMVNRVETISDFITKSSSRTEKSLIIDVDAATEIYIKFEISEPGLFRGNTNIAGALMRRHYNKALKIISTKGYHETLVIH